VTRQADLFQQAQLFQQALAADAARRAAAPRAVPGPAEDDEHSASWDLRFRLVNAWPRESRPAFDTVRRALAPFGYTLSPLHPGVDLRRPRMQAELSRTALGEGPQFAPLVFELERGGSRLRVFVRQFGGRPVPDFPEQLLDLSAPADVALIESILQTYVVCMVRFPGRMAAAA
jgi:hypothetical protein